jgi:hypothetical protein
VDEAKAAAPAQGKGAEPPEQEAETRNQKPEVATTTPEPAPQQEKTATYWQDKIATEVEGEAGSSGGGFIPADPPRVETEPAYSIFDEPSEKAHKAQIMAHGEIIHRDLGRSWLDHALEYAHELDNAIIEIWEVFKGGGDPDTVDFEDLDDDEQALWERLREEGRTPAEPAHGIEAQGEIETAQHKSFWQRLVGERQTAPDEEKPIEEPSGNRFQQLTNGVKREEDSQPPAPSGRGADYWQKAREGGNLTEAGKPSNEIDNDPER